ncbi:MAG: MarR family transcriptional regulator [Eubacteriaceae bacterium]|jgi:DNA-binding MarR family transcriptional regulator|nr:MarR family transcriptional regulator [Eubacteriaceae bacterium]
MKCYKKELISLFTKMRELSEYLASSAISQCGACDLTGNQIDYLRIIGSREGMTFSQLATTTEISKPSVSELISRLSAGEYVYKENCPRDKRVYYIYLTQKGKKIAHSDELVALSMIDHISTCLSEDEIMTLVQLLEKIDLVEEE